VIEVLTGVHHPSVEEPRMQLAPDGIGDEFAVPGKLAVDPIELHCGRIEQVVQRGGQVKFVDWFVRITRHEPQLFRAPPHGLPPILERSTAPNRDLRP